MELSENPYQTCGFTQAKKTKKPRKSKILRLSENIKKPLGNDAFPLFGQHAESIINVTTPWQLHWICCILMRNLWESMHFQQPALMRNRARERRTAGAAGWRYGPAHEVEYDLHAAGHRRPELPHRGEARCIEVVVLPLPSFWGGFGSRIWENSEFDLFLPVYLNSKLFNSAK